MKVASSGCMRSADALKIITSTYLFIHQFAYSFFDSVTYYKTVYLENQRQILLHDKRACMNPLAEIMSKNLKKKKKRTFQYI